MCIHGTKDRFYFQDHDWLNVKKYTHVQMDGELAVLQMALLPFDIYVHVNIGGFHVN